MSLIQEIEWVACDDNRTVYEVGKPQIEGGPLVKEIGEHAPMGPGDTWFYQAIFDDGSAVRIFNMTKVFYGKPKQKLELPQKPKIIT